MRNRLKDLFAEFNKLEAELFKGEALRNQTQCQKEKRYRQLKAFFQPQYRNEGWINPLN